MNKNLTAVVWVIVGLVLGVFILMIFGGFRYNNSGMMGFGQNRIGNQATNNIASNIDKHFIEQMIPHHDGAIAMANLALEKGTRPEIKALAQAILVDQAKENQEMRGWYKDWFGVNVPEQGSRFSGGMMSGGGMHMGSNQDLNVLKSAADFDKEFIEQMIPHHQMAIMMARMLEAGTNRPEMKQLAINIESSQSKEIQQMQDWYQKWYK